MLIIDPLPSARLKRGFSELTGVPQIAAISGQNLLRFCVLHKSAFIGAGYRRQPRLSMPQSGRRHGIKNGHPRDPGAARYLAFT
jgi:hypothetical protein